MLQFDYLVIGSGSAGLAFAIEAAKHGTVGIITKKDKAESNTNYAQGGIAAVLDAADSFEAHVNDTLVAGAGLCKKESVEVIVREGPEIIRELMRMGANFNRHGQTIELGREGGHTANRIVHAADMTGREIERVLLAEIASKQNVTILEHHFALELITEHHLGRRVTRYDKDIHCFGAYALNTSTDTIDTIRAKCTLLATGGAGQLYLHTTNPEIATGDGFAMAHRAKARIANMEFIQFHPTSLYHPDANSFLISEAVRGAGGILRNRSGQAFMTQYHPMADLAPRDIVARAIDDQLKKTGDPCVFLDVTHLDPDLIRSKFPNIFATCLQFGIDITKEQIPVVPAAHYICGGVVTDLHGRTNIHGLMAAGEVACTGVHGANRLASNSLLEALVFARRAAIAAVSYVNETDWLPGVPDWDASGTVNTEEWVLISHNKRELQQLMTNYVGIVRSTLRLKRAFRRTYLLYQETEEFYRRSRVSVPLCQLRNMIAVAYLIIQCAFMRHESRGLHYTTDFPFPDDENIRDSLI
jgi:L-aspartate oxidase